VIPLPPRWVRRLVLVPAVLVVGLVVVTTLPIWLLGAAALSPLVPGRLRPLRLIWVATVQLVLECVALLALAALWVASGFGWRIRTPAFQRAHYRLVRWYLELMFFEVERVLRLRIAMEGPDPDAHPGKPLMVFCRHAGPGDSFLLTHALVNWYAREPRIVLKDTMQWDPAVDMLLNRLPNRFITPNPGAGGATIEAQIAELATGLDENDAFVIFPEGGNFTPKRRLRAIARLRERGLDRMAAKAERLRYVLAPRPGGVAAALAAAPPDAEVMLVAHTGLDHLLTVGDIWRELPMDKTITMRWWKVPAAEIPRDPQGQIEWLYGWWSMIDAWIHQHRPQ
jgi:1-acyl-sn-glycerol-3-phosphate acyltransferase